MDRNDAGDEERAQQRDTEYLQRELGDSLPRALAFVAEIRPPDPITLLAHCLHKFREFHPLQNHTENREATDQVGPPTLTEKTETVEHRSDKPTKQMCSVEYVEEEADYDYTSDGQSSSVKHTAVHTEIAPAFALIGDIFDDDDT